MKIECLFIFMLITLVLASPTLAQTPTRITFSHTDQPYSWLSSTTTNILYDIQWGITTTVSEFLPVDLTVSNNGTINPASSDEVSYRIAAPENEGQINVTVQGYFNFTSKVLSYNYQSGTWRYASYYTSFENTTTVQVTTFLGHASIPTSFDLGALLRPIGITIGITIVVTFNIDANVSATCAVQGPALASKTNLLWKADGDVDNATVDSSSTAQGGDQINVTAKDFHYNSDATLTVEIQSQGTRLAISQPYQIQAGSFPSDQQVTASYPIQVIPEFTPIGLIIGVAMASAVALALIKKHKVKA